MKFKEWSIGKDIFGFEKSKISKFKNNDPIDPLDSEIILGELNKLKLGNKSPNWGLFNTITWGNKTIEGAVSIDVSPLGSYKIIMRKLIPGISNRNHWICCGIFNLNEHGVDKNEKELAYLVYDELNRIDTREYSVNKDFNSFERFCAKLTTFLKTRHPTIMLFNKLNKINDNYFIISFNYRGHGVEAPNSTRTEQFHIHVNFVKDDGIIHCWGNEVVSSMRQHTWSSSPSEWDEYFVPTQSYEEICVLLNKIFMTY